MKRWEEEKERYLEENWGKISLKCIAKNLNKTEGAIRTKAKRLKLGGYMKNMDGVVFSELVDALGYSKSCSLLKKRLIKLGFPIRRRGKFNIVNIDSFWEWAEKNKGALSFAKFERKALGEEPEWVNEKRKADRLNPSNLNHNKKWTKEEDNLLLSKIRTNRYTYKMLSIDLNRTENAIKRRLYDLKVLDRPIQADRVFWSKEDDKKIEDLLKKGYDSFAIAKIMNKTQLGVSNRISYMG